MGSSGNQIRYAHQSQRLTTFKEALLMFKLHSWLVRSHRKNRDSQKAKEFVGFLTDLFLAIVFGVLPMPVVLKWAGWFVCWCALLYIVQASVKQIEEYPSKTRLLGGLLLAIAFMGVLGPTAYDQWREEKAAAQEGDLPGAGMVLTDGVNRGFPMVQIGKGTSFIMTPNGVSDMFPFFRDSGVKIEWGKKGPLLTTVVRDRNGNLVAEVKKNHWKVYPLFCADKNYTKDALEVQDSAGHVVLQVRILPGKIRIQGEWWDTQGSGVRMLQLPDPKAGSQVVRMNRQNQHDDALIEPIFAYPSKDHWNELVDK
jgi:hypothetical protein